MKNTLTPDEFFTLFAKLMAGLEDQFITVMKSRAGLPWTELRHGMRLDHYATAAEVETAARQVFEPLTINGDLLEACKLTREVWGSGSADVDPDDVKRLLDRAIAQAEKSPAKIAEESTKAADLILLALALLEDGAILAAAARLRSFIHEYDTQETPKENTPNVK